MELCEPVVARVEPQQVVLGETESADGRFCVQATMRAVPVVSVQPVRQFLGALIRGVIPEAEGCDSWGIPFRRRV